MGSLRIAALAICFLVLLPCYSTAENVIYDRGKAREYAENFCNQANSEKYKVYSRVDCANFASQATIAGFGGIDEDGNIVGNPFSCVKGAPTISNEEKGDVVD